MAIFPAGLYQKSAASLTRYTTFFAFLLLPVLGCNSSSAPPENAEAAHIKKAAAFIPEFATANNGIPPADIEELKKWAVENGKATDKDFVSTRDGEPYVIKVTGGGKPKKGSNPIVHEAKGKNGMKYMVNSGAGVANEISDQGLGYMTGGVPLPKGRESKGQGPP